VATRAGGVRARCGPGRRRPRAGSSDRGQRPGGGRGGRGGARGGEGAGAGGAPRGRAAGAAEELFSDRLSWGLDDELWQTYGVPGQPYTVLVTPGGVIAEQWFGAIGEDEIRARLDALLEAAS
jgi:hypothetical protein